MEVKDVIPIYKPLVAINQKKYVNECLESNILSWHSPFVTRFESEIAKYLNVKHCLSVCNGSVSLMLALKSLGIGSKRFSTDIVITQNLTYAATVSSILNVGAVPLLIDSDSNYQMNVSELEECFRISLYKNQIKAVIVAGLYGDCCNISDVKTICAKYGVSLIEDAAEVFGSSLNGKKLGTFGNIGSFSFFSNKTLSTVEGGCVVTNDDVLFEEMKLLRGQSHVGNFLHRGPGYNFRFNGLLAAIGCAQIEELDYIITKKRDIANHYRVNLKDHVEVITPKIDYSTEWMPLFRFKQDIPFDQFKKYMDSKGIETRPCFTPISMMPKDDKGFVYYSSYSLGVSETIYKSAFNLPCYPELSKDNQDYIIQCIIDFLSATG